MLVCVHNDTVILLTFCAGLFVSSFRIVCRYLQLKLLC